MSNTITKVDVQKNNKNRVNVYIDNEYSFSCDAEIVYRYGLKVSKSIDLDEIGKIVNTDNLIKAKNDTLKIIERSYKTEKELREKLLKKGYDIRTIDKAVDFAKEYNYVDDRKYAEMYMKDKGKLNGKNKLKYDLIRKGVEEEVIEELQNSVSGDDEAYGAELLAGKKYALISQRENDKRKLYEKLLRFLISKGYSWEVAKSAIKKVMSVDVEE